MAYLDTYCMSVCFPEEYSRKVGRNKNDQQQQGEVGLNGGNTDDSTVTPSPRPQKKQKPIAYDLNSNHLHERVYKLAAITSMYVASKMYETGRGICTATSFAKMSKEYSTEEIGNMELDILESVRVLNTPTSLRFIQELLPMLLMEDHKQTSCNNDTNWMNDVEKSIFLGANYFASLASYCDATNYPTVVAALPSQIALAAIAEAANRIFFTSKLPIQQHSFQERLFSVQNIPYNNDVRAIQKCLVELND